MSLKVAHDSEPESRNDEADAGPATGRSAVSVRRLAVCAAAVFLDCAVIFLAARLAPAAYLDPPSADAGAYLRSGALGAGIFCLLMWSSGRYEFHALVARRPRVFDILLRWGLSILFLALILFLFKRGADFSRGTTILFGLFAGLGLPLVALLRARVIRALMARGIVRLRRAVIIGTAGELREMPGGSLLRAHGMEPIGPFILPDTEGDDLTIAGRAVAAARGQRADEVILAMPWSQGERLARVREAVRVLPLPVKLLPDAMVAGLYERRVVELGFSPAIELQREPLSLGDRLAKRTLDVMVAGTILVLLTPLMAAIAVCIKLDSPGPVLFRQRRSGFDGVVFHILKFRTMTCAEDGPVVLQVQHGDQRVTRLGRVLRTSSLDELPQLINVLAGDMSLVGPRPHAVAHNDHYTQLVADYAFRHHVKPGITGWAQIHGLRGATRHLSQMEARIQYDLQYIASWSFMLDLWILLRTVREVVVPRNAL